MNDYKILINRTQRKKYKEQGVDVENVKRELLLDSWAYDYEYEPKITCKAPIYERARSRSSNY